MTYVESDTRKPSSFPLSPVGPEKLTTVQTWERVKVRFFARIGPEWASALQSLRLEKEKGGIVFMSVPADGVKTYAANRHDELLACWQADVPQVQDVKVNVRSMTRNKPAAPQPLAAEAPHNPPPATVDGFVAVEPTPMPPMALPTPPDHWAVVKRRYVAMCTQERLDAHPPPLTHLATKSGIVLLELAFETKREQYDTLRVKTLLRCWQEQVPDITRLTIRRPAVLHMPPLTVEVSEETHESTQLGVLLKKATHGHIIAAGGDPTLAGKIALVQQTVAAYYKIGTESMVSDRRTRDIVVPRQVAMYLAHTIFGKSLPEIGRRFGDRDHTTVLHAVRKVKEMIAADEAFARTIELLKSLIADL